MGSYAKSARPSITTRVQLQGHSLFGAGLAASWRTFRADAEGIGSPAVGGKLLDSLRCFPARHGLGVSRARVADHPPGPPGLGTVAALLGQAELLDAMGGPFRSLLHSDPGVPQQAQWTKRKSGKDHPFLASGHRRGPHPPHCSGLSKQFFPICHLEDAVGQLLEFLQIGNGINFSLDAGLGLSKSFASQSFEDSLRSLGASLVRRPSLRIFW